MITLRIIVLIDYPVEKFDVLSHIIIIIVILSATRKEAIHGPSQCLCSGFHEGTSLARCSPTPVLSMRLDFSYRLFRAIMYGALISTFFLFRL